MSSNSRYLFFYDFLTIIIIIIVIVIITCGCQAGITSVAVVAITTLDVALQYFQFFLVYKKAADECTSCFFIWNNQIKRDTKLKKLKGRF